MAGRSHARIRENARAACAAQINVAAYRGSDYTGAVHSARGKTDRPQVPSMASFRFFWTDEIIDHLAENGVSPADFEAVVSQPEDEDLSTSTGKPMSFGHTSDGRYITAVYEMTDEWTVLPVTAHEVSEPRA